MVSRSNYLFPDWPAPKRVKAASSTRLGGYSFSPFASFNLGQRVADDPDTVRRNRAQLVGDLLLPSEPLWLHQRHGTEVIDAATADINAEADGSFTDQAGPVCVVMTADCLPVLLCDRQGTQVAAIHAGWRGLVAGVIEAGLGRFAESGQELLAWLGPAIGSAAFEVGDEVYAAFTDRDQRATACFKSITGGKWLADLYGLARLRLAESGVSGIYGGEYCTYTDSDRFFSYRRDDICGRMASLIWLDDSPE